MRKILPILFALTLLGCGGGPAISAIKPYTLSSGELYRFVQDVATNHSTLDGVVGGQKVRGVYLGSDRCDSVAVLSLSPRLYVIDIHHFHSCHGEMTEYGVGEVPPSYPTSADARSVLDNARHGALLYGEERVHFQHYAIATRRLGSPSGHSCMPVETIITHGGLIVLQDTTGVCR